MKTHYVIAPLMVSVVVGSVQAETQTIAGIDQKVAQNDQRFAAASQNLAKTEHKIASTDRSIAVSSSSASKVAMNGLYTSIYGNVTPDDLDAIPVEFREMMQNQRLPIQIIFAGEVVGNATLWLTPSSSRLEQISLQGQLDDYLADEVSIEVVEELLTSEHLFSGVVCEEFESLHCSDGSYVASAVYDKDEFNVYLYLHSELLKSSLKETDPHYLPDSSVQDKTAVVNYFVNHSGENYNLRTNTTLSQGSHHLYFNGYAANNNSQAVDDLYYQRDFKGRLIRVGLVSKENLGQHAGFSPHIFGRPDDLIGFEYSSSNRTEISDNSASAIPIELVMARPGKVEIYRNGRLISTQFLNSGLTQLDTRSFDYGTYEVDIRIYDGDKFVRSEPRTVIKEAGDFSDKFSLFGGWSYNRQYKQDRDNRLTPNLGASYALSLGPASVLNMSSELEGDELTLGAELKQNLSWVNYQVRGAVSSDDEQSLKVNANKYWQKGGINLGYDKMITHQKAWLKDLARTRESVNASGYYRFNQGYFPIDANLYVNFDIEKQALINSRLSLRTIRDFESVGINRVQLEAGVGYNNTSGRHKEPVVDFRVIVPFSNSKSHTEYVVSSRGNRGPEASLLHRRDYDDNVIDYASLSVTGGKNFYQANLNSGFETHYLSGNVGLSAGNHYTNSFTNLDGSVAITSEGVAPSSKSYNRSGVLVKVNQDALGRVALVTDSGERTVINSQNQFVSLPQMRTYKLSFDNALGSDNGFVDVGGAQKTITFYPGNVIVLEREFRQVTTIFGRLVDTQGKPLRNVEVGTDYRTAFTDDYGQFNVEVYLDSDMLNVLAEQNNHKVSLDNLDKDVNFIGEKVIPLLELKTPSESNV